jgi:2',5'-phosphodiesterase
MLTKKIDPEIARGSVICLQEVSNDWAAKFHAYFASKNYRLVTGLYGKKFDGYMGVGIAYPIAKYDVVDIDITRVADTKSLFKPKVYDRSKSVFLAKLNDLLGYLGLKVSKKPPVSSRAEMIWDEALYRFNQMVTMRLKDKQTGSEFCVATYHMPCVFKTPPIMSIHCALAGQHVHRVANGAPYVLAGDFNIKPRDSMYRLLTEGSVEAGNPDLPPVEEGDFWRAEVEPMRSAYREAQGSEPDFTNFAQVKNEEPFVDTLDYIFLSKQWEVRAVEPLPHRDEVKGPLPNEDEPSDHILIAADVDLSK